MAREKVYGIRVPVTMNVDSDTLKKFREMCHRDGTSMSQRVNEFMEEEVKKVEGLATPIAITYNSSFEQPTMRQTSLSAFANLTRKELEQESIDDVQILNMYEGKALMVRDWARNTRHKLRYGITRMLHD